MSEAKPTPYRTVFTMLVLGFYMLIGAWLLRGNDVGEKMFASLIYGLLGLGGFQGVKSAWEHHVKAKFAKAIAPEPSK